MGRVNAVLSMAVACACTSPSASARGDLQPTAAQASLQAHAQESLRAVLAAQAACATPMPADAVAAVERELNQGIAETLSQGRPDAGVVVDAQAQRWLDAVGAELASHAEHPDRPWRFIVAPDAQVWARGVGPAVVAVSQGLLTQLADESELAFLVAHEVAHVDLRHHAARVEQTRRAACEAEAALASFPASANVPRPSPQSLRRHGGVALALVSALPPSPGDEGSADALAVRLVTSGGWDARAGLAVLTRLPGLAHGAGEAGPRRDALAARLAALRVPRGFTPRDLKSRLPAPAPAR